MSAVIEHSATEVSQPSAAAGMPGSNAWSGWMRRTLGLVVPGWLLLLPLAVLREEELPLANLAFFAALWTVICALFCVRRNKARKILAAIGFVPAFVAILAGQVGYAFIWVVAYGVYLALFWWIVFTLMSRAAGHALLAGMAAVGAGFSLGTVMDRSLKQLTEGGLFEGTYGLIAGSLLPVLPAAGALLFGLVLSLFLLGGARCVARRWLGPEQMGRCLAVSVAYYTHFLVFAFVGVESLPLILLLVLIPLALFPLCALAHRLAPPRGGGPGLLLAVGSWARRPSSRLLRALHEPWTEDGSLCLLAPWPRAPSLWGLDAWYAFLDRRYGALSLPNAEALQAPSAMPDGVPDLDGLYRLSERYCASGLWVDAVLRLAQGQDLVLLDLRGATLTATDAERVIALLERLPREKLLVISGAGAEPIWKDVGGALADVGGALADLLARADAIELPDSSSAGDVALVIRKLQAKTPQEKSPARSVAPPAGGVGAPTPTRVPWKSLAATSVVLGIALLVFFARSELLALAPGPGPVAPPAPAPTAEKPGAKPGTGARSTGTVKWFNDAKGYGFITSDNDSEDLFAHFSAINMSGFRTLKEGQRVRFDITQGPKGRQASNIDLLQDERRRTQGKSKKP